MPSIPVPATAHDANVLLGERRRLTLDRQTRLLRNPNGDIILMYRSRLNEPFWYLDEPRIVYCPDGSILLTGRMRMGLSAGTCNRIKRVLPRGWTLRRLRSSAQVYLVFLGQYELRLAQSFRFLPNGSVDYGGYTLTLRDLYDEVSARCEDGQRVTTLPILPSHFDSRTPTVTRVEDPLDSYDPDWLAPMIQQYRFPR